MSLATMPAAAAPETEPRPAPPEASSVCPAPAAPALSEATAAWLASLPADIRPAVEEAGRTLARILSARPRPRPVRRTPRPYVRSETKPSKRNHRKVHNNE